MEVAFVHDYMTQRGGAERVVLSMLRAFPHAPLYTSLYDPAATYPGFADADVRPSRLNHAGLLRRNHRLALPMLAHAFSNIEVDADVVVTSSSGWAHGVRTTRRARRLVYCHNPARWLYQRDEYVPRAVSVPAMALAAVRQPLVRWDQRAARAADRYLANSTVVRDRIRRVYGIDAEVLPPPHAADAAGPQTAVPGVEPGYFLVVGRLMRYKNVDAVVRAFADLPCERLVVVGSGPEEVRLRALATANVTLLGSRDDAALAWLYANAQGLVSASFEDFGLTPLEAAAFGVPSAVLRFGGFVDTVVEDVTGTFFDDLSPTAIRAAVRRLRDRSWDHGALVGRADAFSEERFAERLRAVVHEEAAIAR